MAFEIERAFAEKCCHYIICAYFQIVDAKTIKPQWSEPTISRHLKKHLRTCLHEAGESISVLVEYPEDYEEIDDGVVDSKKEVYFDLMLTTFASSDSVYFGVEAKILIEENFLKRNAKTELSEYISEKGMRKFIDGIYRKRGCMIAYIMQGEADRIVQKLNAIILSDSRFQSTETISGRHSIENYNECYISEHHTDSSFLSLKHLMLTFG